MIRFRSKGGITDVPLRKRLAFAALAIIPITQCGAPVIGSGYARLCEDQNRKAAKVIIEAVEAYKKDSGLPPRVGAWRMRWMDIADEAETPSV